MNQINVIRPYKSIGTWMFDDTKHSLVREPFVAGADEIINHISADIPDAENGFILTFSAHKFPGAQHTFYRSKPEDGGWWYSHGDSSLVGWLCPALFLYFPEAPEVIYVNTAEAPQ